MATYEDWRIFRKILKRDLALDRTSGRRRGSRRCVVGEDDLRGGSEIRSTIVGVGVVGAESICTGSMISPSLSALMTQEINPIIKIWLGFGEDEDPAKCTILFIMEITLHTPTWRANC